MTNFTDEVARVHNVLSKVVEPTPLQHNQYLSDLYGGDIWLKREDLSPVRSYKVRGAYAFLHAALIENPDNELFVCSSAGNHAQGFAYACREFGKKGVVFMPVTTPNQKIMKTRSFGEPFIDIRLVGDGFDAANQAAIEFCNKANGLMVPPFDHSRIIQGQATVAKEIFDHFSGQPAPDRIVLPVGGGGLAAGVTTYLNDAGWTCDFSFVEPNAAPSFHQSLNAGERVQLQMIDNFVDGAAVAKIGEEPFRALSQFQPSQVILAETNGICATMIDMLNVEGIVLEPAGALTIEALRHLPEYGLRGRKTVCVVSGGNFDFERLPEVKERALKFTGCKKYYVIQMPQRPGALKDFLSILGPDDDIARFEYLKKSARNFGSVLLGIETSKQENFDSLTHRFDQSNLIWNDITDNETLSSFLI
ncbi:MAG: threonine ammonia-lyase IlvA [Pseudomonadota bacterium]